MINLETPTKLDALTYQANMAAAVLLLKSELQARFDVPFQVRSRSDRT